VAGRGTSGAAHLEAMGGVGKGTGVGRGSGVAVGVGACRGVAGVTEVAVGTSGPGTTGEGAGEDPGVGSEAGSEEDPEVGAVACRDHLSSTVHPYTSLGIKGTHLKTHYSSSYCQTAKLAKFFSDIWFGKQARFVRSDR